MQFSCVEWLAALGRRENNVDARHLGELQAGVEPDRVVVEIGERHRDGRIGVTGIGGLNDGVLEAGRLVDVAQGLWRDGFHRGRD